MSSCIAQDKQTIYLIFNQNEAVNCIKSNSNYRHDKSLTNYKGAMVKSEYPNNKTSFIICKEHFSLIKNTKPQKISKGDVSKLKLVEFEYLIKEYIKSDMFNKRDVFENIFFIEKINEEEYLKYEVHWEHYIDKGFQN
ncbi:MAG: hypothetical protein BM564_03020 [Bacteroidetes bacterium MedPE-SWsnd-G2]|nr:MAG: hypothetical protein BM564_03020 [Bacteroidetes bacterium MedPE-SWsnd-G2]